MNEDVKDTLDYLRARALSSISQGMAWDVEMCTKGIAAIERLAAEVERLTPFSDAVNTVDAMNKHKILGMTWRVGTLSLIGNGVNGINGTPESACYSLAAGKHCVHEIEDRDAGPSDAR